MKLRGVEYLRRKLAEKRPGVLRRYKFYNMQEIVMDLGISTPPKLAAWQGQVGWCKNAVDSLADRLQFRNFENDAFRINEIFSRNNPDVMVDSAVKGALISSCDFIYISVDDSGYPRLQVIDGGNATGQIDTVTGLLYEGYVVLERDPETKVPTLEAYFKPFETDYYAGNRLIRVFNHKVNYPLLVPIIFQPSADRPFGTARITHSCMNTMADAIRTIKRCNISAEFYSFPQKWVSGLATDAEMDKWKASMSAMMSFTKDEDGDRPTLGQFQQASMSPHLEMLKSQASLFAGDTGLTLDDLGFATSNPSSSEAIKAAHESLRRTASKAQRVFGIGLLNTGMLAASLRDEIAYERNAFSNIKLVWEPVFEPDFAALSAIGDGALKINQAVPGYFDSGSFYALTGIRPAEE